MYHPDVSVIIFVAIAPVVGVMATPTTTSIPAVVGTVASHGTAPRVTAQQAQRLREHTQKETPAHSRLTKRLGQYSDKTMLKPAIETQVSNTNLDQKLYVGHPQAYKSLNICCDAGSSVTE